MKMLYFISLLIMAIFFNACGNAWWNYTDSNAIIQSPEQIDSLAIPPSNSDNLFSPPKNGYARLIIYAYHNLIGSPNRREIFIAYEFGDDRALCVLRKDSSCIVNIKAGNSVMLYPLTAMSSTSDDRAVIFTPKNQHIYCINMLPRNFLSLIEPKLNEYYRNMNALNKPFVIIAMNFEFKNKNTCLKEYMEMYKPKHRQEQEKWFNGLVKDGDKRAYQE